MAIYGYLRLSCQHFLYGIVVVYLITFRKCFRTVKLHKTLALAKQNVCEYKHMAFFHIFFSFDEIKRSAYYSVSFEESMNKVTQNEQVVISIQYCNELANLVESRYLKSVGFRTYSNS